MSIKIPDGTVRSENFLAACHDSLTTLRASLVVMRPYVTGHWRRNVEAMIELIDNTVKETQL